MVPRLGIHIASGILAALFALPTIILVLLCALGFWSGRWERLPEPYPAG